MRLLRTLSLASAVGAWVVIVIGGYVSASGSGLGCGGIIFCDNPRDPVAAVIETTHRLAAWVEGLLVLAMLVLVLWRYRSWRPVRNLTALAFVLVAAQSAVGIVAVATELNALVVAAHTGFATAFLAVAVINAAAVIRGPPPTSASPVSPSASAPETA